MCGPQWTSKKVLPRVESGRNFVEKAVNWALRSIGKRSSPLHAAAVDVARRLATAPDAAPGWVGKDALRELTGSAVARRMAKRRH